jgi:tRNA/rRNA methyltransferase
MFPLSGFAVSIVEPEFGINLGYLARTAANFGMSELIVCSRRRLSEENLSKARLFAAHGRKLVDEMEYASSVASLRRRFEILIGTTAIEGSRKSNLTRKTMSPESCAKMVFQDKESGRRSKTGLCFLFGRDTTGLTNGELKQCDYALTIRTRSAYNTLNVSHAAAIVFYVFSNFRSRFRGEVEKTSDKVPSLSSRKEKERAVSLFMQLADLSEFQTFKVELLRETLERMLNRGDPSSRELYLLMGLASRAGSKIKRLSSPPSS